MPITRSHTAAVIVFPNGPVVYGGDDPHAVERWGLIPGFLQASDPDPAWKQLDKRYEFGGWRPIEGCTLIEADEHEFSARFQYPGDPEQRSIGAMALGRLGGRLPEILFLFPAGVVMARGGEDGTGAWEIARLD
jgi:hypothetical protein